MRAFVARALPKYRLCVDFDADCISTANPAVSLCVLRGWPPPPHRRHDQDRVLTAEKLLPQVVNSDERSQVNIKPSYHVPALCCLGFVRRR